MHEAGLARDIAKLLRKRGLRLDEIRVAVRGGTHEAREFEIELRTYLAEALPDQAAAALTVEIRRAPFGHLCPRCGVEFTAPGVAECCPNCGAETVPELATEQVEIELRVAVR
jgi:Zn finger protein HypA/HybF involved in hydrogenase expression